ncbi:hypothetical protein N8870_05345 [Alphaproteobacteria bacterium]|nr:hypothetical protein [Alphaproteobacteria bacterium]
MSKDYKYQSEFLYWKEEDIEKSILNKNFKKNCFSFESFLNSNLPSDKISTDTFIKKYYNINWSQIISSERAFTDYSMLQGSTGNRKESLNYIENLVINISSFISCHLQGKRGVVCQTADTILSHIVFKLAKFYKVKIFTVVPCLVYESKRGGGFFGNDEFLKSDLMISRYGKLKKHMFTKQDILRINNIKNKIIGFKNKTEFSDKMKGTNVGKNAISPQVNKIFKYLIYNKKQDKNIFYTKIDPLQKLKANFFRLCRKYYGNFLGVYGNVNIENIPSKSIFYAMHFQPEQSTLTQGNWYLNQIALIENISKSLPLGYHLIIKEHPWGRGTRPIWQYQYLSNFHNIMFCDAGTKDIIQKTKAVLTISGSIILEALVLDKPAIMFGKNFFDYAELIYKIDNISELPNILFNILVLEKRLSKNKREEELNRLLLSYLDSLIDCFPDKLGANSWAKALFNGIKVSS